MGLGIVITRGSLFRRGGGPGRGVTKRGYVFQRSSQRKCKVGGGGFKKGPGWWNKGGEKREGILRPKPAWGEWERVVQKEKKIVA